MATAELGRRSAPVHERVFSLMDTQVGLEEHLERALRLHAEAIELSQQMLAEVRYLTMIADQYAHRASPQGRRARP